MEITGGNTISVARNGCGREEQGKEKSNTKISPEIAVGVENGCGRGKIVHDAELFCGMECFGVEILNSSESILLIEVYS